MDNSKRTIDIKFSNKLNLVLASLFFSIMTVCVKKIDARIPVHELVFFRSLISISITSFIIKKREINPWGNNKTLLVIRGLLGTLALLSIFYAIRNMPLSISTVIQYTYPIFISIFAAIFINEKLTKNIFFGLISGWLGILILLNPSQLADLKLEISNKSVSIAFLGAISTALAYVTVKKLSYNEDVFVIIKYFPLVSLLVLSPYVIFNWITPNLFELIWIIGIGIFTQLGQTFLTIGLKNMQASVASSINYLQVVFASIWGILIFEEIINIKFILGSILVLFGTYISTSKISKKI